MILLVAMSAWAAKPRDEEIVDGLPPWMTQGESVRLDIVRDLLDTGNTFGALEILRQMRSEGFDGPMIDLYQGIALRIDGVTSEAERLLLQAQKRLHDDPRPSAELCLLYADDRRVDEAIAACEKATRASGDVAPDASMFNNYAFLLLSAGRADDALRPAERAVELDGSDPTYRNNLGLVQVTLGREDVGFRTLTSTMPRADAAYMVAVAVENARGAAAAAPWFEKALSFEPNHALTRAHLSPPADPATEPAATKESP